VNTRQHSTIQTAPEELVVKDREAFSALPETRYVGVKEETRKVTADCLLSYGGSRYSVPWMFATKHVWVRLSKGYFLEIYSSSNVLIATHKLSVKKGTVIIEQSHYRTATSNAMSLDRLRIAFTERFPGYESFLERLQAQKRFNARYHLFHILQLAQLYTNEDFQKALTLSLEYNIFTVNFISGFLEKHCQQSFDLKKIDHVQRSLFEDSQPTAVTRHLSEYRLALEQ
jgi:hypothetical protein